MKELRCSVCKVEFEEAETIGVSSCPACGTTVLPQLIDWDIELSINWDDLRLLANWALFYTQREQVDEDGMKHFYAILEHIRQYQPDDASHLTINDEIEALRKDGFDIQLITDTNKINELLKKFEKNEELDINDLADEKIN